MEKPAVLFVVATPIGNLGDLSHRAAQVLAAVDTIAAEDTRRCRQLLSHLGISRPVVAYHDHSDARRLEYVLQLLRDGSSVALVSDAGTPLISDPGYRLVHEALAAGVRVVAVPGPCAAVAALSVAGLPSDRFVFEGFLPARHCARETRLAELGRETRTLIFYESPRRVLDTLRDMATVFGGERRCTLARELTKVHETLLVGTVSEVLERVAADPEQQLGEIVLVLAGAGDAVADAPAISTGVLLEALLKRLPLKAAVACAVEVSGRPRNEVYRAALALRPGGDRG
ncbi:MAG: 16S rRNA (cytidine(1402)-2'-O)-methyltransferase [Pseudomonadales bacterium]|nr:16S rRNA (cytidine(1402)-2'-O)-methyltransferase [Pseudomonadales bacterium]MBP9032940.1 16S rRNA (cytidine(1402)-2'-O)-methyltransferase [Pseudomonadales bacterium]